MEQSLCSANCGYCPSDWAPNLVFLEFAMMTSFTERLHDRSVGSHDSPINFTTNEIHILYNLGADGPFSISSHDPQMRGFEMDLNILSNTSRSLTVQQSLIEQII